MNRILIILVLAVIVLCWNFILTGEKVGLTDQARVLQGLSSALAYKTAVTNYWNQHGSLPLAEDSLTADMQVSVDLAQTIVNAIEVGKQGAGVISVHYTARPGLESPIRIDGKVIHLIPSIGPDRLEWQCKGTIDVTLLPKNCSPQ